MCLHVLSAGGMIRHTMRQKIVRYWRASFASGARLNAHRGANLQGQSSDAFALAQKGRVLGSLAYKVKPGRADDMFELDECWTCVRKCSNRQRLWVALCQHTMAALLRSGTRALGPVLSPGAESLRPVAQLGASATLGPLTSRCSEMTEPG